MSLWQEWIESLQIWQVQGNYWTEQICWLWLFSIFEKASNWVSGRVTEENTHTTGNMLGVLPADEDTEEEEPAATFGLSGSRDRRSLLVSLPDKRSQASLRLKKKIGERQFKVHRLCNFKESGGTLAPWTFCTYKLYSHTHSYDVGTLVFASSSPTVRNKKES